MSEWQPIETAPQDGTRVLIFVRNLCDVEDPHVLSGAYVRWPQEGDYWENDGGQMQGEPTHWMPLPEPPS